MSQRIPRAEPAWLTWFLIALPLVGAAIGPLSVGGDAHWLVKTAVGLLVGAGLSGIGLKGHFIPPLSTIIAGAAVGLLFSGVAVLAVASSSDPVGTIIFAAVVSAAVFRALTK